MTDTSVRDDIEDEYETELSRLGSSKALYALTEGDMEAEAVLSGLADRAATAAETFGEWADDASAGGLFERAAEIARDHADRIAAEVGDADPTDSPGQVADVLREQDETDARLGGVLAWAMVTDRTLSQAVGFFVGDADPGTADLFRDLRSDVDELRASALDRTDGADREVALTAANQVVEAAYDQYVATLEGLGVKVKPVC